MSVSMVCEIGINDSDYNVTRGKKINGKSIVLWTCPFYKKWHSMMNRCYGMKSAEAKPTYAGCTVCDEWLTFSKFKEWMESQNWKGNELDKDFLVEGNKMYSPETCLFTSHEVNSFIVMRGSSRGMFPVGVTYRKDSGKYSSSITTNEKRVKLGSFQTPMLAHQAWQKKKLELAIELQSRQDDDRVRKGLQRVIDKLDFHIKNGIETVSL